jgi:hypothetical protein
MDKMITLPTPQSDEGDPEAQAVKQKLNREAKIKLFFLGFFALLILVGLVLGAVLLLKQEPAETSHIRDVFIIFIALESVVIGAALVILMVQLATLINLLQNEIKPILKATNETASTLRGTVEFLSNNVAEPVIKMNEYLAGIKKLVDLIFRPGK